MRTLSVLSTLAAASLLFGATSAAAQACLGLPTRDGEMTVAGVYASLDGDSHYGAELSADVSGPAAFSFGYAGLGADGDRKILHARASYDFFLIEPAICGVAGVLFDDDPAPGIDQRLGVPVGIGIGKTLRSPRFSTTVFAIPQYVWLRETPILDGLDGDAETSNEFMAEAGVTFGLQALFVGGSVVVDTFEGSDPGFRIRAGLRF